MAERYRTIIFSRLKNERGAILAVGYMVIALFIMLGVAFLITTFNEARFATRQMRTTKTFYLAEAGIERAIYDLRKDFVDNDSPEYGGCTNGATPSWADGCINGLNLPANSVNFYDVYGTTNLGEGSYTVQFLNTNSNEDIWIRSVATYGDLTQGILVYVKSVNFSPWNNAIFAGAGASGAMVNGNVDIRGSVHILGTGLTSSDLAINLGGTAELVGNNYNGMEAGLKAKLPAIPTTVYNGETVETLNAELRVKNGQVALSGSSSVGESDVAGNSVKETVDAAYVTDGYSGSNGSSHVYSDNGTTEAYDLGDSMAFPSLSDPAPADSSITYQQYLRDNALVINDPSALSQLSSISPNSSFTYSDAKGTISMDGSGNMTVDGIVYIEGGNLNMAKAGPNKTITYTGSGSILVTGNAQIDVDLVTDDYIVSGTQQPSFPTRGGVKNVIGIMTPNNISFTEAQTNVMGLFYAENSVIVQKQTDITGTIVSNYFDMGTNVPAIYQVPETTNYLPPGMIGGDSTWYLDIISWQNI
ncbi:MAG: hypothetical protein KC618_01950 [Candidatus Omnitrophica bacterium]|nr:hypothetical protein [Candidatus Omnitrophota bacterium]